MTDSYRFTVDRLKQLIRGIQLVPGLPYPHPKVSGTKQELINRLIDLLRSLKAADSPAYYNVAKLIGEAQGITYVSTDASGTTSSSAPQAGSSAPHNSYGWQSGYSAPAPSLPSDYAVRPSQFGLLRSPSRTGSSSASVYGAPAAGSAPNGNLSASYTQHNRLYSNSPNTHYRPLGASANGTSVGPSPASSHALPSRPGMSTSYGNSLSNQIPTSLPVPLPPKSAIAGQPAIPMNFKPSPFFNVISAVSTVTTLPSE